MVQKKLKNSSLGGNLLWERSKLNLKGARINDEADDLTWPGLILNHSSGWMSSRTISALDPSRTNEWQTLEGERDVAISMGTIHCELASSAEPSAMKRFWLNWANNRRLFISKLSLCQPIHLEPFRSKVKLGAKIKVKSSSALFQRHSHNLSSYFETRELKLLS